MAAVVGVPDKRFQEVGAAYVILAMGHAETDAMVLKNYCAQYLANYKIPKSITLVSKLPTLPVGKVDKVTLRKRAAAEHVEKVRA